MANEIGTALTDAEKAAKTQALAAANAAESKAVTWIKAHLLETHVAAAATGAAAFGLLRHFL